MSTTTKTALKQNEVAQIAASAPPVLKGSEVAEKAKQEAQAFAERVKAMLREGSELGNIALDQLAEMLGESANKSGRPTETAYLSFALAVAHRGATLTYERRADLCRKAIAAGRKANPLHKDVAVQKAKATSATGSASYRINAPASVEIALGE